MIGSRPSLLDYDPSLALIPPFRFAIIEDGLLRGAYPTLRNFRFLSLQLLKSIVSLVPEKPTSDLLGFCSNIGITSHHFPVSKYKESVSINKAQVSAILQVLIDPDSLPCYIHCLDGVHVTGIIVACFRKLQNWVRPAIIHEFCRFDFGGEMIVEETQFLDDYDGDIIVPDVVPSFLWNGLNNVKHPSIKLVKVFQHDNPDNMPLSEDGIHGIDASTSSQRRLNRSVVDLIDRGRLSYFDVLLTHQNSPGEDRIRHEQAKETFSIGIRAMGLESSVAINFRTRMLSLQELDSAHETQSHLP